VTVYFDHIIQIRLKNYYYIFDKRY